MKAVGEQSQCDTMFCDNRAVVVIKDHRKSEPLFGHFGVGLCLEHAKEALPPMLDEVLEEGDLFGITVALP